MKILKLLGKISIFIFCTLASYHAGKIHERYENALELKIRIINAAPCKMRVGFFDCLKVYFPKGSNYQHLEYYLDSFQPSRKINEDNQTLYQFWLCTDNWLLACLIPPGDIATMHLIVKYQNGIIEDIIARADTDPVEKWFR